MKELLERLVGAKPDDSNLEKAEKTLALMRKVWPNSAKTREAERLLEQFKAKRKAQK